MIFPILKVARLGSGMTWGTSKYEMKGVHEMAMEIGRVVVTGHAAEVGIVGWSMGSAVAMSIAQKKIDKM